MPRMGESDQHFPFTYISCPCTLQAEAADIAAFDRRASHRQQSEDDDDFEDKPLDPHEPRSNFNLYPYDRLLFCDECHELRCPRCWTEEVTNWYCPNCLFDVPGSIVRTDGNRCTRNCYDCPLCFSPLSVNALDQQPRDHSDVSHPSGPYFLACPYCEWSSLDSHIEFSKPTKITEQLARLRQRDASPRDEDNQMNNTSVGDARTSQPTSRDAVFANLTKFYKVELQESNVSFNNPLGDASYNSPTNLNRIMQMYSGVPQTVLKRSREKPRSMREALGPNEGLILTTHTEGDTTISRLHDEGYGATPTAEQRLFHPWNHHARFVSDLWPVPSLLRTRRSKRCGTCRHILTRHDDRKSSSSTSIGGSSIKYKIRLLAQNNIPRLSLRPFSPGISASAANPNPAFALTPVALKASADNKDWDLTPGKTVQYLLTLTNPLFETVRVTLATPSLTPGRIKSRVTVLCPTFEIGADGDMWDEALSSTTGSTGVSGARSRGGGAGTTRSGDISGAEDRQPEAGKVWEKGRNWTSVIVEVVPGTLTQAGVPGIASLNISDSERPTSDRRTSRAGTKDEQGALRDGEEVLQLPIFVRVEWEADVAVDGDGGFGSAGTKTQKQSRELAFWSVLGAGRILG